MRRRPSLVVFVKAPRLGRVKSRLAREIGPLAALRFYRETTRALLRRLARDPRWHLVLAVTPSRDRGARFWPAEIARLAQGEGDLGERMRRLFRQLPPGPALIVGSDIPALAPGDLAAALRALNAHDAVFGPALDGGYWLVGLRHPTRTPRELFGDVRWSTPAALADSRASLPRRWSVALGPMLEDVDDAAAWRRQRNARPGGRAVPPRVRWATARE